MKQMDNDVWSNETAKLNRVLNYPTMTTLLLSLAMNLFSGTSLARGVEIQEMRKAIDFNRNWTFAKGDQENA